MAQIKALECDRCSTVIASFNIVRIFRLGEQSQIRHFCDGCMDELYFHMQPKNKET